MDLRTEDSVHSSMVILPYDHLIQIKLIEMDVSPGCKSDGFILKIAKGNLKFTLKNEIICKK